MMWLRNGGHGFGVVTKVLHWPTVLVVVAQSAVGWSTEADGAAAALTSTATVVVG